MNSNIFGKKLLLTRVDFDRDKRPRLCLSNNDSGEFYNFTPQFDNDITIKIDITQRYCTGWHSLETGESFTCPEKTKLESKYEQCQKCQKRTGFNPAFYNVSESDISEQQQVRNSQPHIVYLAHFQTDKIKVGISYSGRGISRLLEQGARSALILGEFPSANIARRYEAQISAMDGICENVKANAKIKMLEQPYSKELAEQELIETKDKIQSALNVEFDAKEVLSLDEFYTNSQVPSGDFISACDINSGQTLTFSGNLKAQAGYLLIAQQQDENIIIPLKKYAGYNIEILESVEELEMPERQVSLFDF